MVLTFALTICSFTLFATNNPDVKEGDVLKIGKPIVKEYKHIKFPKSNFIIKRGGIVSYQNIVGSLVLVTGVKEKKDGTKIVKISRNDGGRFFGSHTVVKVDIDNALKSGELIVH
ncbi:hypothetical protein FF125_10985 [Aureibaculum algae]|uniref:Uncharacterized protein n=2 Tax=Aureibaculum algae TaxID=2584122 RepID=A0A5B7TXD2_9FLAO|nr:hypothetical protein FF125_10985 [Aureibaculum algae]